MDMGGVQNDFWVIVETSDMISKLVNIKTSYLTLKDIIDNT